MREMARRRAGRGTGFRHSAPLEAQLGGSRRWNRVRLRPLIDQRVAQPHFEMAHPVHPHRVSEYLSLFVGGAMGFDFRGEGTVVAAVMDFICGHRELLRSSPRSRIKLAIDAL